MSESRICWECGNKLHSKLGGGYHFALKPVSGGDSVRVHKACMDDARADLQRQGHDEKKSSRKVHA